MDRITIIVPCYNEEEVVETFYDTLKAALEEVPDPIRWSQK